MSNRSTEPGLPIPALTHPVTSHPATGPVYWGLLALPAACFALLEWGLWARPLPWDLSLTWVPSLGLAAALRVDGLAALMLALITGIGALVFVYAHGYLDHDPRRRRLIALLSLFMLAMMGAVTADSLPLLFLFWELTSLLSFLLAGWNHADAGARAAARGALLVTMAGGLALLGGLILLAQITGAWTLSGVLAAAPAVLDDPRLPAALILIMLGAFTKSAQVPFHFWLPNAMAAPTPVSAYLHSATMVKLGIYLLARLDPAFNDLPLWEITLVGVGTVTALWAGVLALRERDLKRILARTTVSALGILVMLVGLPGPAAGLAVVAFLYAHALYKAPLFMIAGNIDHATGTRRIDHLMGLRRAMPWTAAAAILAGLSMAGLPLSFGFLAKGVMAVAKEEAEVLALVGYATLLASAIAVAVAGVAAVRVFWGPQEYRPGAVHEAPWCMRLPPLIIALLALEYETLPTLAEPLLAGAARAVSPTCAAGLLLTDATLMDNLPGLAATLGLGLFLWLAWDRLHAALERLHWLDRLGPEAGFARLLHGLPRLAAWQMRRLQSGRLGDALRLTLAGLLALGAGLSLLTGGRLGIDWPALTAWPDAAWAWVPACLLIAGGAIASLVAHRRVALIMAGGLVGYGSALLFLFAGAPDLAFTQFVVEAVLAMVATGLLPFLRPDGPAPGQRRSRSRALDSALAAAAGLATFALLAPLAGWPLPGDLADWFGAQSLVAAHGRNVVNVIIVDFRALDTLGEIAVLAFSLLAARPLLAALKGRPA